MLFTTPSLRLIRKNRSIRGFTLIEMVVTIILIGIIAGMLAPFIKSSVDGFVVTRVRSDLTSKGHLLLERLNREIREADPATIQITGGNKLKFTQLQNLNSLQDIGGNIIKVYDACRTVIVYQSGNLLLWDEDADGTSDSTLSTNVSNISFSYSPGITLRSGVVVVELTMAEDDESEKFYREIHILNTLGNKSPCSP
jgi:prepilin-type N-terminal cleavage/methylation domain-containing protein